jgi:hypothetical protein
MVGVTRSRIAWIPFLAAALVSLLTSPITAIWMLLVAPAVLLVGVWRVGRGSDELSSPVVSAGFGLLIGPAAYVGAGLLL